MLMKTNLLKMATVLAMGIAVAVSCKEDKPLDPVVTPNFPEKVVKTLAQGESCDVAITPNMDWEVTISGDTDFFELRFNDEAVPVANGKAGEFTLSVVAKDVEDFEQRQAVLTMSMDKEEKVIAEINRNGKEAIFSVFPAKVENGEFVYGDDGYEFEDAEGTEFSLSYINGIFQTYIKVNANFDWRLKDVPEWVEVNVVAGTYVDASKANVPGVISLRGNNPKYPLGGAEGKLVFVVDDNSENPEEVDNEITLALPKVEEIFEVTMPASGKFNKEGEFFNEMNGEYGSRPLSGSAVGVDGVYVLAYDSANYFEWAGSSTENKPDEYSNWVNITLTPENEEDVLKSYDIQISVKPNDRGVARQADIFVLPASVVINDPKWDILNDDYDDYKEEYRKYLVTTITQEAENGGEEPGEELIIGDENTLANQGAKLEHLDPNSSDGEWIEYLSSEFGVDMGQFYQLTVKNPQGMYSLSFAFEPWNAVTYRIGDGLEEISEMWFELGWNSVVVDLTLDDAYNDRFVVLQTGDENENMINVAVLKVLLDPEADIVGGGSTNTLKFAYEDYGIVSGCKLRKMTLAEDSENELFLACTEMFWGTEDYPIYELTYGPNRSNAILTSTLAFDSAFMLNDADESWLSVEGDKEMLMIEMFDYDSETGLPTVYKAGAIIFNDNSQGYPMPQFAVVCVFDPNFE